MNLPDRSFKTLAESSQMRVSAFRALQDMEERYPVRVLKANLFETQEASDISPDLTSKRVNIKAVVRVLPGKSVNNDDLEDALGCSEFSQQEGTPNNIVTLLEDDIGDYPHHTSALPVMAVCSTPLVVSPHDPYTLTTAFWGLPISPTVRVGFGTQMIPQARHLRDYGLKHPPTSIPSEATRYSTAKALQWTAIVLFNGQAAFTARDWDTWTIPNNMKSVMTMFRQSGVAISTQDEETLIAFTSESFTDWANKSHYAEGVSIARRARQAFRRICSKVDEVTLRVTAESYDINSSRYNFIRDLQLRFDQEDHHLSMFDAKRSAQECIILGEGRTYRYQWIDTGFDSKPMLADGDQQPIFSF